MRRGPGRTGALVGACLAGVLTLSACGSDIDLPEVTLPDITLPDITPPDITLPTFTPPDITLPTFPGGGGETPTDEPTATGTEPPTETEPPTQTEPPPVTVTATETASPPAPTTETVTETAIETTTETTTVTETETAAATETTPPPEPEQEESEDGGIPWWVWLLVVLALLGLVGWLLARRSAASRVRHAWTQRVDAAVERLTPSQNALRRPATLVPADQDAVRRAVAELRDLSVVFTELSSTAPDEVLGHQTAATADALRGLATASEIENEGLASGRIASFEERQDAEAHRLGALQDLDESVERLMTQLAG